LKKHARYLGPIVACAMLVLPHPSSAQTASTISPAISTPNKVDTRLGPLEFKDGAPNTATAAKLYDNLDFTHAFDTFNNTMRGVSIAALHKGFRSAGVKDGEAMIFSELMGAKSLFLTANADTIYYFGALDLSKGPMVLEVPPKATPRSRMRATNWDATRRLVAPAPDALTAPRRCRAATGPAIFRFGSKGASRALIGSN
jgi:hypothetical protein